MFLHLGRDVMTPYNDIIGIFDLDFTTKSRLTRDFLTRAERENRVEAVTDDLPASFVVCRNGRVYLSQISAATLKKRAESGTIVVDGNL